MEEHIRIFEESDYRSVIELWLDAGLFLSLSDGREELLRFADHCPDSFFVIEKDNEIIGTVIGAFDGRRGYVHHLAVSPKYQGQGLGKLLMHHLESWYQQKNVVKIHLMIEKSNAEVGKFYEKIGWHYRDDIILMSKTLRDEPFEILGVKSQNRYITKDDYDGST